MHRYCLHLMAFLFVQSRQEHGHSIQRTRTLSQKAALVPTPSGPVRLPGSSIEDVRYTFKTIVAPGRNKMYAGEATERSADQGDEEELGPGDVFVPYKPADDATEKGCVECGSIYVLLRDAYACMTTSESLPFFFFFSFFGECHNYLFL